MPCDLLYLQSRRLPLPLICRLFLYHSRVLVSLIKKLIANSKKSGHTTSSLAQIFGPLLLRRKARNTSACLSPVHRLGRAHADARLFPQEAVDVSRDPSSDRAQAVAVATILIREDDYLLHKKELTEVSQAAMNAVGGPSVALCLCSLQPLGPCLSHSYRLDELLQISALFCALLALGLQPRNVPRSTPLSNVSLRLCTRRLPRLSLHAPFRCFSRDTRRLTRPLPSPSGACPQQITAAGAPSAQP